MQHRIRTAEDLLAAGDIGRCELLQGRLAMMLPMGGVHGRIAMRLGRNLSVFVEERGLGEVLAAETGFLLSCDPDTVRAPDVAFVRKDRAIGTGFIDGAPNLAVEVLSPGDRPGYVRDKVAEWLEAGAEAVWVVDPTEQTVVVHLGGGEPETRHADEILRGGAVLPGFELPLAELF